MTTPIDILSVMPPSADESETCLISGALNSSSAFQAVKDIVAAAHFRSPRYAAIWTVLAALDARGAPWAPQTVLREAERLGLADRISGEDADRLSVLQTLDEMGCVGHVEVYAPLVVDAALRRQAYYDAAAIVARARDGSCSVAELADNCRASAERLEAGVVVKAVGHVADLADTALEDLAEPKRESEGALSWGFPSLDRAGVRIEPGSYPVLAAMTGGGKTTLAVQTAFGIAERTGRPVLYCSLEMPPVEILRRAIVARSGHPVEWNTTPSEETLAAWRCSQNELRALPMYVPEFLDLDLKAFLRQLSALCRKLAPAVVFVDHIGRLRTSARDLYHGMTEVSQRLRDWTLRGEKIPVVAIAQLRRVEKRQDGGSRPPELFDLKDSGSIENDATAVLMLDRPWVRGSTENRARGDVSETDAALYLKKNRHGAAHRKVPLHFDGPRYRLTEVAASASQGAWR